MEKKESFLKYLLTRPSKIAYLILIGLFFLVVNCVAFSNLDETDVKGMLIVIIIAFDVFVFTAAMYHPYKEWKDGFR